MGTFNRTGIPRKPSMCYEKRLSVYRWYLSNEHRWVHLGREDWQKKVEDMGPVSGTVTFTTDSGKETRGQWRQESVVLKPRAVNISRGKTSKLGLMLPGSLVKWDWEETIASSNREVTGGLNKSSLKCFIKFLMACQGGQLQWMGGKKAEATQSNNSFVFVI